MPDRFPSLAALAAALFLAGPAVRVATAQCQTCDPKEVWASSWAKEFERAAKVESLAELSEQWLGLLDGAPGRNIELLRIDFTPVTSGLARFNVAYEHAPSGQAMRSYTDFPQSGIVMAHDSGQDLMLVANGLLFTIRKLDGKLMVRVELCDRERKRTTIGYSIGTSQGTLYSGLEHGLGRHLVPHELRLGLAQALRPA